MSKLIIRGGRPLVGTVDLPGAKNAILPLLAATVLTGDKCEIHNCPSLTDVDACEKILRSLNCKVERRDGVTAVDSSDALFSPISESLMREMRSSIVFLGAIVGRFGRAVMSNPGGCELGPRPIDIHLSSLRKMGVSITERDGILDCSTDRVCGADIVLPIPSVGATENIMLAAVFAKGVTHIVNAAREPEIRDLGCFLNECGADIEGHGTSVITIRGVRKMHGTEHFAIPDRITAATYLCAVTASSGEILIKNAVPDHLTSVIAAIRETGCEIIETGEGLLARSKGRPKSIDKVSTMYYPGFPTDAGSLVLAVMTVSDGTGVLVENIFENRYRCADELTRMGASIKVNGRMAVVIGKPRLNGANVKATDLRAGAALVIAGLAAEGITEVTGLEHIDRGYESIERSFSDLGADIRRV